MNPFKPYSKKSVQNLCSTIRPCISSLKESDPLVPSKCTFLNVIKILYKVLSLLDKPYRTKNFLSYPPLFVPP
jgi:hypothetical protein